MVQISIDDKPFNFTGPKPETVEQLVSIIGKYLFDNGRVIRTILVDGEDGTIDVNSDILSRSEYNEVKFYSVDLNEDMVKEIGHLLENKEHIVSFMNEFSHDLLNDEWANNAHKSNRLSTITVTIVVLLSRACETISDSNKELLEQIESLLHNFKLGTNLYTSAASFKDTLCIADVLSDQLIPAVNNALDLIQGPVKSYFDLITGANQHDFPA